MTAGIELRLSQGKSTGFANIAVVCSEWKTHVFRGQVSVCFSDGTLDVVDASKLGQQ